MIGDPQYIELESTVMLKVQVTFGTELFVFTVPVPDGVNPDASFSVSVSKEVVEIGAEDDIESFDTTHFTPLATSPEPQFPRRSLYQNTLTRNGIEGSEIDDNESDDNESDVCFFQAPTFSTASSESDITCRCGLDHESEHGEATYSQVNEDNQDETSVLQSLMHREMEEQLLQEIMRCEEGLVGVYAAKPASEPCESKVETDIPRRPMSLDGGMGMNHIFGSQTLEWVNSVEAARELTFESVFGYPTATPFKKDAETQAQPLIQTLSSVTAATQTIAGTPIETQTQTHTATTTTSSGPDSPSYQTRGTTTQTTTTTSSGSNAVDYKTRGTTTQTFSTQTFSPHTTTTGIQCTPTTITSSTSPDPLPQTTTTGVQSTFPTLSTIGIQATLPPATPETDFAPLRRAGIPVVDVPMEVILESEEKEEKEVVDEDGDEFVLVE